MAATIKEISCPECGTVVKTFRNPVPTVDTIIELTDGPDAGKIVLIERLNPPHGWAIPGGFVDYGESVETAAVREAKEEVGLDAALVALLGVYSDPRRDDRMHTISTVFCARASGTPKADDDAKSVALFDPAVLPEPLCFDHAQILADYRAWRERQRWSSDK